ncbi:hypothetical protein [Mycetocola reblochoni]|uniref:ATP-binding protein n=1 Tax=Mycetocola reblochoni REB411 TaxID=1255698 RepID=A0A1R4JCA6_9MICO|nr:hypothetical protein [Mycetocola reblochoni]SJN29781.1 hypothetical protein FM119_06790 [Mycetocola reblochoni REB411]
MTTPGEESARRRALWLVDLVRETPVTRRSTPPTVLIDGPSGAGKSGLALALHRLLPGAELVRLDDVYPGWSGLSAGVGAIGRDLLRPRAAGAAGRWRRWDWAASAPAGLVTVRPDRALIVEGCGTLSADGAPPHAVRVWLDADDAVRRERALRRDAGAFDAHWDMWDEQWSLLRRSRRPELTATVVMGERLRVLR